MNLNIATFSTLERIFLLLIIIISVLQPRVVYGNEILTEDVIGVVSLFYEQVANIGYQNEANLTINIYFSNSANDNWEGNFTFSLSIKDKEIRNEIINYHTNANKSNISTKHTEEYVFFSFTVFVPAQKTKRFSIDYIEDNFIKNNKAIYDFSLTSSSYFQSQNSLFIFKIPINRGGLYQYLDKIEYKKVSPIPDNIFREGSNDVLVWKDPLSTITEPELGEIYRIEVEFYHYIDYLVILAWIGSLALTHFTTRLLKRGINMIITRDESNKDSDKRGEDLQKKKSKQKAKK